jgi:hypothetical protein
MIQSDTGELKAIALENYNRIPATRGDDLLAFIQVVFTWLVEWIGDKPFRKDVRPGYCAFVLAPDLVAGDLPQGVEETYGFKEDTTPILGGNVYLTDYALNNVWRYPGTCKDLSDVIGLLKSRKLSQLPFVAFDVDAQLVYVYSEGVATLLRKFALRADIPRPFTIDVFVEMLEEVYDQHLKYPSVFPPIWHDPKHRVPCRDTELVIQGHVSCILKARAQGVQKLSAKHDWLTVVETKNNAGRTDISVYKDNACVVVSELKVLRHCRLPDPSRRKKRLDAKRTTEERHPAMTPQPVSPAKNEKWAMHGAKQAARYKLAQAATSAALVLYDMRESDADIPTVQNQCKADDVKYVRYYLYNQLPDKD